MPTGFSVFAKMFSNVLKTTNKLMQNTKLNTHICYVVSYVQYPSKNSHIMSNFNYYKMVGVKN